MKNLSFFRFACLFIALLIFAPSCQDQYDWEEDFDNLEDAAEDGFDDDTYTDNDDTSSGGDGSLELESDVGIAIYRTDGDNIILSENANRGTAWMRDPGKHAEMWELVTDLIPADARRWLYSFEVFDGGGEWLGFVYNLTDDLQDWNFALDISHAYLDGQTLERGGEFITTVLHEYGHILSLNDTQLDADENADEDTCGNYNPGEGCAFENSYIDEFYERFWEDIAEEHESIDADDYDALDDFYAEYQDRFWTDYSATNPAEDFAEVFAYFITLDEQPGGNQIKDAKIRMLYEYPELTELRDHMRQTAAVNLPQAGVWSRPKCRHAQHRRHTAVR